MRLVNVVSAAGPVMIQQREGGYGNYQQNIAIFGPDHANCNCVRLNYWKIDKFFMA